MKTILTFLFATLFISSALAVKPDFQVVLANLQSIEDPQGNFAKTLKTLIALSQSETDVTEDLTTLLDILVTVDNELSALLLNLGREIEELDRLQGINDQTYNDLRTDLEAQISDLQSELDALLATKQRLIDEIARSTSTLR